MFWRTSYVSEETPSEAHTLLEMTLHRLHTQFKGSFFLKIKLAPCSTTNRGEKMGGRKREHFNKIMAMDLPRNWKVFSGQTPSVKRPSESDIERSTAKMQKGEDSNDRIFLEGYACHLEKVISDFKKKNCIRERWRRATATERTD